MAFDSSIRHIRRWSRFFLETAERERPDNLGSNASSSYRAENSDQRNPEAMKQPQGCHVVGSMPYPDAETAFRHSLSAMPNRLKRVTDGETGERHYFTVFQAARFNAYPEMLNDFNLNSAATKRTFTDADIDEGIAAIKKSGIDTGYDDAAIESYKVFKRLREEGVIPPGVRFQVSLPTVANVIMPFIQEAFLARVEPIYEEALFRAMRNIQAAIPHEDLAIQIDIAGDTAYWERANGEHDENSGLAWFPIWWEGDIKEYTLAYTLRMMAQVEPDVELGIHNCYGDMDHKHWFEPKSLAVVVERGQGLLKRSPHPVKWFHCPVPKSAVERPEVGLESYLAPLRGFVPTLQQHDTELYLGLVHEGQLDLTRTMIAAAQAALPADYPFGVSQECGGGRMATEDFEDAMQIAANVSEPILSTEPGFSKSRSAQHDSVLLES